MPIFSRLFKMFLIAVFTPLILLAVLLAFYQNSAREEVLERHDALARMVAANMAQYVSGLDWRMAFARELETPASAKTKESVLESALASNPDFLMLAVLDGSGRELYSAGPRHIVEAIGKIDLSEDPYLPAIAQSGMFNLSSFDANLGVPAAEMLYPLKDGNFLFGVVSFFNLWARLQTQSIGVTGSVLLLDAEGKVFGSGPAPQTAEEDLKEAVYNNDRLLTRVRGDGAVFVGALERAPVAGAYIAVLQDKKEAYSSIHFMSLVLLFFILFVATFSYFASLRFAGDISQPILDLQRAADSVAKADFSYKIEKNDNWREFDSLIDSVNKMTDDLRAYHQLKMQEEMRSMKESLFQSIAHDLRAPVFGLQGYIELLQSKKTTQKDKDKYIAIMKTSVADLSALLEDVLDAAKLEEGLLNPVKEKFDFKKLADKTLSSIAVLAEKKGLTLEQDIPAPSFVYADKKLLARLLTNLVGNAIKFTEKGKVSVSFERRRKQDVITVRDTGVGIAEEEKANVFKKYHQADHKTKGYGLGLGISREIARSHNGKIKLESEAGKGTAVTVTLPAGGE